MGIGAYRHVVTLKQPGQSAALLDARAIVPSGVYQARILADGASAYWPLDDPAGTTAIDLAGTNHGAISGGVTLNQPGVTPTSRSMTFNGTTGQIVTASNVSLLTPYTIEAWVRESETNVVEILSTRLGYPTRDVIRIYRQSTNTQFTATLDYANASSPETLLTSRPLAAGQWYHVAVVLTSLACVMYVDGVALTVPSTVLPGPFTGVSYPVTMGNDSFGGFGFGSLSDVAIYRRALTADEIAAHYALRMSPPVWYCSLQSAATQVIDGQSAFFVRGRYHPDITTETQLVFEGRTFQVQGITDVDERHTELQLLCVEVVARAS